MENNNSAKFVFWYMLSLVSLVILTIAVGNVVFQIINKYINEAGELFRSVYSSSAIKFALSSLIVAIPVYFWSTRKINKSVLSGELNLRSTVRKWMNYFILLVASLTMIGYLIAVFYTFLEGELTTKFILKTLTVLVIAGTVFSYYFFDIKRKGDSKEKVVVRIYSYTAFILSLVIFIGGIFMMDSPVRAKKIRQDAEVENQLSMVENQINSFVMREGKLPNNLKELLDKNSLNEKYVLNPVTEKQFGYKVLSQSEKSFEICSDFQLSTDDIISDESGSSYSTTALMRNSDWNHKVGEQCFERKAWNKNSSEIVPLKY